MTPRALRSTGKDSLLLIGPFPSKGCPSGFTTLPSISLPTGTSTTFPVLFAISPSLTFLVSPKRTNPTLSSSKFKAIPNTSFGNSTNSELITFSRPDARATPSPTSMISPTSETSMSLLYFSNCSLSRFVI